jgi:hypothetical protein
MGRHFSFALKLVAKVLILTMLNLGATMAAYACPFESPASIDQMMEGMPCHEMDQDKPVHCAIHLGHGELALHHLEAPPALTPPSIIYIAPAIVVTDHSFETSLESSDEIGRDNTPPYLRTQRMRV